MNGGELFKLICELPTWLIAVTLVAMICAAPFIQGIFIFFFIFMLFMVLVLNIASKFM